MPLLPNFYYLVVYDPYYILSSAMLLAFSRVLFFLTAVAADQLQTAPEWGDVPEWRKVPLEKLKNPTPLPLETSNKPSPSLPPSSISTPPPALQTKGLDPGMPVNTRTELRILPVGDSITVGVESTGENGYRLPLWQYLTGMYIY